MSDLGVDTCKSLSKELYSAVLSDVLDSMGLPNQTMRPFVRPLSEDDVLFGPARTGLFMPRYGLIDNENPYDIEIALIDDLRKGDVPVFACGGPVETITPWGELLTTAAMMRGAHGFVTDGLVRDARAIRKAGFPVFHGGIRPLDSAGRSKMMLRDTAVECAGVRIEPGDLIFGDVDGVVVLPGARASEAIERAQQKINRENKTRDEILAGNKLADIYNKYGIL
jgi:regulator of RNase E activity RraA